MLSTILSGLRTIPLPPGLPRATGEAFRRLRPARDSGREAVRQLSLAAALAGEDLGRSLSRAADAALPARIRFPAALLAYLLLVFTLEGVFLHTFSPMAALHREQAVPHALEDERLADADPESFETLAAALPSAFAFQAPPALLLGSPILLVAQSDEAQAPEAAPAHTLLTLPAAPEAPAAPFDSVRLAVNRASVRMPVDRRATHPLDRDGFLATATDGSRLRRLFARVDTPGTPATLLAARPDSAIAPPTTRLDELRRKQVRSAGLGTLCALFESGVRGIFAVGYDPKGGTSYGKYQISSSKGAMRNFLVYLERRAPSWAKRLRASGPSDTGGTAGAMPREWKRIAREHPGLFERLQDDFIHTRYYSPSLDEVRRRAGLDLEKHPEIVKEVLWSTAVQHGPNGGANIFVKASLLAKSRPGKTYAASLLEEVFRERERRLVKCPVGQRPALRARLRQERDMALNRLRAATAQRTTSLAQNTDNLL